MSVCPKCHNARCHVITRSVGGRSYVFVPVSSRCLLLLSAGAASLLHQRHSSHLPPDCAGPGEKRVRVRLRRPLPRPIRLRRAKTTLTAAGRTDGLGQRQQPVVGHLGRHLQSDTHQETQGKTDTRKHRVGQTPDTTDTRYQADDRSTGQIENDMSLAMANQCY